MSLSEMSNGELDLLRGLPTLDRDFRKVVYCAHRDEGKLWLAAFIKKVEELVDVLAADANHEPNRRRRQPWTSSWSGWRRSWLSSDLNP